MVKKKDHLGYKQPPIIYLDSNFHVIEILHKFLRVTDLLVKCLLTELMLFDRFEKNYDPFKHPSLKMLSDFLINDLKHKGFAEDMSEKDMLNVLKGMQGPKKKLFFQKINLATLFPIIQRHDGTNQNIQPNITRVFRAYWDLHNIIREEKVYDKKEIEDKVSLFKNEFLNIFSEKLITPYLHMTFFHLADQYELFNGKIKDFSTEGLEKLNDFTTAQFFRSTNKRGYVKQILERDQRIEIYKSEQMNVSTLQ